MIEIIILVFIVLIALLLSNRSIETFTRFLNFRKKKRRFCPNPNYVEFDSNSCKNPKNRLTCKISRQKGYIPKQKLCKTPIENHYSRNISSDSGSRFMSLITSAVHSYNNLRKNKNINFLKYTSSNTPLSLSNSLRRAVGNIYTGALDFRKALAKLIKIALILVKTEHNQYNNVTPTRVFNKMIYNNYTLFEDIINKANEICQNKSENVIFCKKFRYAFISCIKVAKILVFLPERVFQNSITRIKQQNYNTLKTKYAKARAKALANQRRLNLLSRLYNRKKNKKCIRNCFK